MSILREHGYPVERGGTQSFGHRPDLYGLDDIHLEIKRAECARIWEWMEQSKRDSQRFQDAMIHISRDSEEFKAAAQALGDFMNTLNLPADKHNRLVELTVA